MKKHLLALATAAVCSPASAYEIINNEMAYLDFYGEVKARAFFYDNESNDYTFGDSKVGVDARYAATDTINLLATVEGEINFDADETRDEDDLYFSKYYAGVQHEVLGTLTYGKHATSSDDLNGVDYSEAFGGESNLNPVDQHDSGLKYVYRNELFTASMTYGFEAGDNNRELTELYGQYNLSDLVIRAGIGSSTTNTSTNNKDEFYMMTGIELDRGDYTLGASYYYTDIEDNLNRARDVSKDAFALAGKVELIEKLFGYAGYELIMQDSKTRTLDGNVNNFYLGSRYEIVEWASIYAEANYVDDGTKLVDDTALNFALGATVTW
ncbi:outer membrane protein OmpT [Vibrio campbellii]|uniref:porin n=1 Tax=Vibrio campbellii TaxID=680 RepID=UPI000531F8D6|nr:porin [Vibrio campbellii]KGR36758.1 outer membrane protein OmpT [Vibrio campbellii]